MTSPIRLAIAGVGNCASSLIQGIAYYRDADPDDTVPGPDARRARRIPRPRPRCPVAAFDVDQTKVGTDLGKAIHAGPNNTIRFAEVGELGVTVQRGPTFDGLGSTTARWSRSRPADRSTSPRPSATPGPTSWSRTYRSAPSRRSATTPRRASTPAWPSSTPSPSSSRRTPSGPASSATPASPSSETTSRARWARRSSTAS